MYADPEEDVMSRLMDRSDGIHQTRPVSVTVENCAVLPVEKCAV